MCLVNFHIIRVVNVGRALWKSSGQTSLFNQGHLQSVIKDHVQMAFFYLQGWFHILPGQTFASALAISQGIFQVSVCDHYSFPVAGHHRKEPCSTHYAPLLQILPPETLHLQAESSQLSQTSLLERCLLFYNPDGPLLDCL